MGAVMHMQHFKQNLAVTVLQFVLLVHYYDLHKERYKHMHTHVHVCVWVSGTLNCVDLLLSRVIYPRCVKEAWSRKELSEGSTPTARSTRDAAVRYMYMYSTEQYRIGST